MAFMAAFIKYFHTLIWFQSSKSSLLILAIILPLYTNSLFLFKKEEIIDYKVDHTKFSHLRCYLKTWTILFDSVIALVRG